MTPRTPATSPRPGRSRKRPSTSAGKLSEAGYDVTYVESGAPGRGNVIARLAGAGSARGALLVHGHLDVVPADAADWSVHPFSGEVKDGYVWGRGAVDMKGALAMTLAVARAYKRGNVVPARDLVFAFLADEEAGGFVGARWLVAAVARLGNLARLVGATLRDTANVTMFDAGYKANVVPSVARATVDGRLLPGREGVFEAEIAKILGPEVELDWDNLPPVQTTFDGALVDAMSAAVTAEDPGARLLPYMLSAGTDVKSFDRLGIRHFGFTPLKLPPELDFTALFHGVDERVPVEALEFGTRVLYRLLAAY